MAQDLTPSALLDELLALPAKQRVPRLRAAGNVSATLASLAEIAQKLTFVEAARALAAAEMLVELADAEGAGGVRARVRRTRAQALSYSGRLNEALEACRDARHVAQQVGDPVEAARASLASMHPLGELGRFDEAVRAGEDAHSALRAAGEFQLATKADLNLGAIYQKHDQPARALFHLDRAAEVLDDDPLTMGLVQCNRGEALLRLDRFDETELAFKLALRLCEANGATLVAGVAEGNLADLAARRGRLQQALFHFEQARRRVEGDSAENYHVRMIAEQAEVLATLGLTRDALRAYEEVLPRLELRGLAIEIARARSGQARCLIRLGRVAEARSALAGAADEFARLGNNAERARVMLLDAELALAAGETSASAACLQDAARGLSERPTDIGLLGFHTARLALARSDLPAAEDALARSLDAVQELDIAPVLADLLHTRGLLRARQGDAPAAVVDLRSAVRQIERVRGSFQADRFRAAFLGDRQAVYEDLTRALIASDSPAAIRDAFHVVEQAKSRSLLDQTRGAIDVLANGEGGDAGARLADEADRIRGELNGLYARLADPKITLAPSDRGAWREAVRGRERDLSAIEIRLAAARGPAQLFAPPVGVAEVQAALHADAALLEFGAVGDELMAWLVTRDDVRFFPEIGSIRAVEQAVARLQFQLGRSMRPGALQGTRGQRSLQDTNRELALLWDTLLHPVRQFIADLRRVVIVPHGPLHGVPFHALRHESAYWIEKTAIGYAPSASVWAGLMGQGGRTDSRGALVVGVADDIAPQIQSEAREVATILDGAKLLVGQNATVASVSAAAGGQRLIHFACHARFERDLPLASGLRLADRWLTLRDIYALRLSADIVTLGACDSGRSLVQAGDELVGLLRAFLAAGASCVLASLWPVQDEFSVGLFRDIYTISNQRGKRQSDLALYLREAQLARLSDGNHPVLWAPYFAVGRT
jgi:tetratricopeptide (TPR) repeat protein